MPHADRQRAASRQSGAGVEGSGGEHGNRKSEADAAEDERRRRTRDACRRQERERQEAEREQAGAGAHRDERVEPRRESPRNERRRRQHADDRGAADRRVAPDRDHEQHGEEEHADERPEEQAEADVRGDRPGERRPPTLLEQRRRGRSRGRDERERGERRLHGEDRAPVEHLRDEAAERGPERRAERAGDASRSRRRGRPSPSTRPGSAARRRGAAQLPPLARSEPRSGAPGFPTTRRRARRR